MATRTTTKKAELKTSTAKPATEKEAPAKKTVTKKTTKIYDFTRKNSKNFFVYIAQRIEEI